MARAKPSLDLLRSMTDELAIRALADAPRLIRAEIAERTGLSKPTVAESVRRLESIGLVVDTGERTTGRGGVGTYYSLAPDAGCALVVQIAPGAVVAETIDSHGAVHSRVELDVARHSAPAVAIRILRQTARAALRDVHAPMRVAVVSAAGPVDRHSQRIIELPDAPFLAGALSPAKVLQPLVDGPVIVDNDVHWAARAERAADPASMDDFAYLYLGEGLGCAIVSDGEVVRGHTGIAGEVAHITTTGPDGRAVTFTEVFAQLGLRHPGSTAIDVERLLVDVERAPEILAALASAVSGVLAAIVALSDPSCIVLGGPWGASSELVSAVRSDFAHHPRTVTVKATTVQREPSLVGARGQAIAALRAELVNLAVFQQPQTSNHP